MNKRPLFFAGLSFSSGILIAGTFPINPLICAFAALILIITLAALKLFKIRAPLAAYALALALGMLMMSGVVYLNFGRFPNGAVTVLARVCEPPERSGGAYEYTLDSVRYISGEAKVALKGRTSVILSGAFSYNDTITFTAALSPFSRGTANAGFASRLNYHANALSPALLVSHGAPDLYGQILGLRENISRLINDMYPSGIEGVVNGLITGNREGISPGTVLAFRKTGVAHILAVSGLHVGVLTAGLNYILGKLRANVYVRLALLSGLLALYCAITGFTPSIVRASLMFLLLLIAQAFEEKPDNLSILSFAFMAVLALNPASLFSAGFQLSFSAVFGIYSLTPAITRAIKKPRSLASSLGVTAGASAGTAPIFAASFGSFYPLSLISNLVAVPIASAAVMLSALSLLLGALYMPLALPFAYINSFLINILDVFAKLLAAVPFAQVSVSGVGALSAFCLFAALFAASPFCLLKTRSKAGLISSLCVLSAAIALFNIYQA